MELLYNWVTNISFYLIFITVLGNMLPSKKYEKYIRFFSGMVLILLVMKPFTSGLRVDDRLSLAFESISFQTETQDLKKKLTGMEAKRLSGMVAQFEETMALDLERMVKEEGFYKKTIKVSVESDQEKETFGTVKGIYMVLTSQGKQRNSSDWVEVTPITPVSPVDIQTETGIRQEREEKNKSNSAVNALRKRISEYYGLEAEKIEIQLEDE